MAELQTTVNLFPGAIINTTGITIPWASFDASITLTDVTGAKADVFTAALIKQLSVIYPETVRSANLDVSHRVTIPTTPSTEQAYVSPTVTKVYDRFDIIIQSYVERTTLPTYNPSDFAP